MIKFLQMLHRSLFRRSTATDRLLETFDRHREALQQQYFTTASASGLPRGLRWVSCDWLAARELLLDRTTKQPNLLISVNLRFEAVAGGDMEDVAAVANIRDACAVFQWQKNSWTTSGRTLFNMNPGEARERLAASYESI